MKIKLFHNSNKSHVQYQVGNTQITALRDVTNFMPPTLFKDILQDTAQEILKKYHAEQAKGVQTLHQLKIHLHSFKK